MNCAFFFFPCGNRTSIQKNKILYTTTHCQGEGAEPYCDNDSKDKNCASVLKEHLNKLHTEPSFTLMLCSSSMFEELKKLKTLELSRKRKCIDDDTDVDSDLVLNNILHKGIYKLFSLFPEDSEIGFCTALEINGSCSHSLLTSDRLFCPSLLTIQFPKIPGLNIHKFPVCGNQPRDNYHISTGISPDTPVKCIILFLSHHMKLFKHHVDRCFISCNKMIYHYLHKQDWKLAVGGAFVDNMSFHNHEPRQWQKCYGIAFTGEKVEAASVVITECMHAVCMVEQQLQELQASNILQGQCVAIMFTYKAVREIWNGNSHEGVIFQRFFPNIPVFAIFSRHRIGLSYLPNQKKPHASMRSLCEEDRCVYCWTNHSSVFVIISVRE